MINEGKSPDECTERGLRLLVEILKVLYARAVWSTTPMSLSDMREVGPCYIFMRSVLINLIHLHRCSVFWCQHVKK